MSAQQHPTHFSYLTSCVLLACLASASAVAASTEADERIEVQGQKTRQAFPTLPEAKAELKQVAGGTNLIQLDKLPARQATLQDALGFEPGIVMQSFFGGNDQPRLNIRGSGVQSNPVNRGIQLLYDSLPLNQSDGSFVIGFLDPKAANMVSVYRGANGLRYGGTTLGGAVNLMSRNGTNSAPSARLEYGSDKRLGASLQTAGQSGDWDYYALATRDSYDGYRHHSESERTSLSANLGVKLADNVDNRTYVNFSDNYFEIPFVVPKARALADPQLILGDGATPLDNLLNVYNRDPHRDSEMRRLANKTRVSTDSSLHEFGVYLQQIDDTFTDPLTHNVTDSDDFGLEYAFMHGGEYLTKDDKLLLSVSMNRSDMQRAYHANNPQNGDPLPMFGDLDLTAQNTVVALQWQAQLSQDWQLVAAAQWVDSQRDIADRMGGNLNQDKGYSSVNPKLGLNYQLSEQTRLFANVSQTAEAPTYWELVSASVSPKNPQAASLKINDLKQQESTTIEIGGAGQYDNWGWDLAWYRTDIDEELISIVSDFAVNGQTNNYEAGTIHQGLELELTGQFGEDLMAAGDQLSAKLVYNYSDFYFDGGEYGDNQIAGIPEQLIQAELQYQLANGIYLAPSIRWQPDETPVDHANSQFQDDYLLVGLKAAYQATDKLKFYADMENLTDETYQTSYVIRGFSSAQQPTFLPGFGPSITVGMNYQF